MKDMKLETPKDRNIFFSGHVDEKSMKDVTSKIIEINESDELLKIVAKHHGLKYKPKPIKIYIDSYGGLVYQAYGLISVIEKSEVPVHTICTGAAMSCGFAILISGHKRFCYEHGTPMYHQIGTGFNGKIQDLEEKFVSAKKLQKRWEELVVRKTKIKKEKLKKVRKSKFDWYMTATKAKKLGVIDKII